MTIPIAVVMGLYLRVFRPGRILEVSLLGLGLLLLSIWIGGRVAPIRSGGRPSRCAAPRSRGC